MSNDRRAFELARWAAALALLGVAMLVLALVGPLLAVLVFLSLGQLVGIAATALYIASVLVDYRARPRPAEQRPLTVPPAEQEAMA